MTDFYHLFHSKRRYGYCSTSDVWSWRIEAGYTSRVIYVTHKSQREAVISVTSRKHGQWYFNGKPYISMTTFVRSCDKNNVPALNWNEDEVTCCNDGMGGSTDWCKLSRT